MGPNAKNTHQGPSPNQSPNQGPIAQAQSELGPEIFKAHFEYAPATSKEITDKLIIDFRSIING